ncbi:hypothetical protein SELMODRAFT_425227 [Selaginella moellendorffii]|uniref:Uncharacterized protein n=1 Tax=Selaginella moellendorffii TaxID=88036 RepID=D8SSF1_SELML|nr:hypothetical protein SELMODRAFT_425227 [Selaginella moellendorffii]
MLGKIDDRPVLSSLISKYTSYEEDIATLIDLQIKEFLPSLFSSSSKNVRNRSIAADDSELQLSNGDIILCVPIKNQLSLRNQTLQLLLFGLEVGSCKKNTIPVLQTSNTIAARFGSVRKLIIKHSYGKNRVPLADEEPDLSKTLKS